MVPDNLTEYELRSTVAGMLDKALSVTVLGVALQGDVYIRNPYRLLGLSASAPESLVLPAAQSLRNRLKLGRGLALERSARTGYDDLIHIDAAEAIEIVSRLNSPRERLVSELFWPHLPDDLAQLLRPEYSIGSVDFVDALNRAIGREVQDRPPILHALAIAHHNRALALVFRGDTSGLLEQEWRLSMEFWAEVLSSNGFWRILEGRIRTFNDSRLSLRDLLPARDELTRGVLAFNVNVACCYAKANATPACSRQLELIAGSNFPEFAKSDALRTVLNALAQARLDPLTRRAKEQLGKIQGSITWQEFDQLCTPLMKDAAAAKTWIADEHFIQSSEEGSPAIDAFCEVVARAGDSSITYRGDDRPCALLYDLETKVRLKKLAVSSDMQRRLDSTIREDKKYLAEYLMVGSDSTDHDCGYPLSCWFIPNASADAQSSIVLHLYKVTEVDDDGSVHWNTKSILVPRSPTAKLVHEGNLSSEDVPDHELSIAGHDIVARIKDLSARSAASQALNRTNCNAAVEDAQRATVQSLVAFDGEYSKDILEGERRIRDLNDQCSETVSRLRRRCALAVTAAEQNAAPAIGAHELACQALGTKYNGVRGALRLHLPIGLAISVPGAMFAYANAPAVSVQMNAGSSAAIATGVGLCVGIATGEFIRRRKFRYADLALASSRKELAATCERLSSECEAAMVDQRADIEAMVLGVRATFDAIARRRAEIEAAGDLGVSQIREHHKAVERDITTRFDGKLGELRLELATHVKRLSAQAMFPPYKAAKGDGFLAGSKPSEEELERLRAQETRRAPDVKTTAGLITVETANHRTLESALRTTFSTVQVDGDWLVVTTDCRTGIRVDKDAQYLLIRATFNFRAGATELQKLSAVNAMNRAYVIIKTAMTTDGQLVFSYDIPLNAGIHSKTLALAVERFAAIPQDAIKDHAMHLVQ